MYAEVVVPHIPVFRPLPRAYEEFIHPPVNDIDNELTPNERRRVISAVQGVLTRVLTEAEQDQLASDPDRLQELLQRSLRHLIGQEGRRLGEIPIPLCPQDLKTLCVRSRRR